MYSLTYCAMYGLMQFPKNSNKNTAHVRGDERKK
nr:MAG TPA: hypothetical protein [Caudoviricetes sp.]